MKLQSLLEEAIYNHLSRKKYEPTIIIVNSKTWEKLICEIVDSSFYDEFSVKLIYRGIRVLRSYDVEENKFEVA